MPPSFGYAESHCDRWTYQKTESDEGQASFSCSLNQDLDLNPRHAQLMPRGVCRRQSKKGLEDKVYAVAMILVELIETRI